MQDVSSFGGNWPSYPTICCGLIVFVIRKPCPLAQLYYVTTSTYGKHLRWFLSHPIARPPPQTPTHRLGQVCGASVNEIATRRWCSAAALSFWVSATVLSHSIWRHLLALLKHGTLIVTYTRSVKQMEHVVAVVVHNMSDQLSWPHWLPRTVWYMYVRTCGTD